MEMEELNIFVIIENTVPFFTVKMKKGFVQTIS